MLAVHTFKEQFRIGMQPPRVLLCRIDSVSYLLCR
jgi:hypothetical protein